MIYYIWKDWCNDNCQLSLRLQNSVVIPVAVVPKEIFFLSVSLVNSKLLINHISFQIQILNIYMYLFSFTITLNQFHKFYFVLFLLHTHAQRDHWYLFTVYLWRIGMTWAGTLTSLLCIVFISLPSSSADKKMCTKR